MELKGEVSRGGRLSSGGEMGWRHEVEEKCHGVRAKGARGCHLLLARMYPQALVVQLAVQTGEV